MAAIRIRTPAVFCSEDGLVAGFSTRHGGFSPPPYDSLNVGLGTADSPANVDANRRMLLGSLGLDSSRLAMAGQVHGASVGVANRAGVYRGLDGLITGTPGLVLGITAADCAVVLLADPAARLVGACHAGWRGVVAGIVEATVTALTGLGASVASIRAWITPCISAEAFEVGEEVAACFAGDSVLRRSDWTRPHVDLKHAVASRLRTSGLPEPHIEVSPECTYRETRDFFSHRADPGATGRMMGFIALRVG